MAPRSKPDLSLVDFPMINLGVKIQNQLSSQVSKGENQAFYSPRLTQDTNYLTPINTTLPITKKSHHPDQPFDASGPNLKSNKAVISTPHAHQNQQLQTLLTNLSLYITHLSSHIETLSHSIRHAAASEPKGPEGEEEEEEEDKIVLERCNALLEERDMLEAKMTVYTGHLKLGRMVLEGEGEGWGAWRFRVPRPGDWMGGGE